MVRLAVQGDGFAYLPPVCRNMEKISSLRLELRAPAPIADWTELFCHSLCFLIFTAEEKWSFTLQFERICLTLTQALRYQ